jgi:ubiquinone/menaquinone biosynthesis C-methylase UbiE
MLHFQAGYMTSPIGTENEQRREQWLALTLKRVPSGSRILDAGAGELKYKRLCEHLEYVSQDFAQYDGVGNRKGLQTGTWDHKGIDIISDITSIPEPDASFDAVMCVEVLEHLPNPQAAISEFSRLLKAGGLLILTAPFCSLTHFAPYYFTSGFSVQFLETHLKANKFEVLEMISNGNYFEYMAQELRRIPQVADTYAQTRLGLEGRIARRMMLRVLERLAKRDAGSQELLCYGHHVLARKGT